MRMLGRSSLSAALVALSLPAVLGLGASVGAGTAHADPGPVPGGAEGSQAYADRQQALAEAEQQSAKEQK